MLVTATSNQKPYWNHIFYEGVAAIPRALEALAAKLDALGEFRDQQQRHVLPDRANVGIGT